MRKRVICSRYLSPLLVLVAFVLPRGAAGLEVVRWVAGGAALLLLGWPEAVRLAATCRTRLLPLRPDLGRRLRRLLFGVTIALIVSAATAVNAMAAGPGQFGKNLGDQVRSLSTGLFLAVAGLVTLPILGRRDVNGGVVLFGLVVVLGGFIFAQDMVKHVITDLWHGLPDQSA